MADWLLHLFENTSINETWLVLSINGLIVLILWRVILFALKKGNYNKRSILYSSMIGAFMGLIWLIITGQFLLSLSYDLLYGHEQGNWIFVLKLFGTSRSLMERLIGEPIYSSIMMSMSNPVIRWFPISHSFTWFFSPSYFLGFISGFLGSLVIAVSSNSIQNIYKLPSRSISVIIFIAGFALILTGISISVFYQAMILASG